MTWLVECYDPRTDELLAEVDLDALASGAVRRLIGDVPGALAPDQVRVVAPLFAVDPACWAAVTGPSAAVAVPGTGWLGAALLQLVSGVVGVPPEDLGPAAHPVAPDAAQGLLDRFSPGVRLPPGEVFLDLVGS